jgi:hypothetical protein
LATGGCPRPFFDASSWCRHPMKIQKQARKLFSVGRKMLPLRPNSSPTHAKERAATRLVRARALYSLLHWIAKELGRRLDQSRLRCSLLAQPFYLVIGDVSRVESAETGMIRRTVSSINSSSPCLPSHSDPISPSRLRCQPPAASPPTLETLAIKADGQEKNEDGSGLVIIVKAMR